MLVHLDSGKPTCFSFLFFFYFSKLKIQIIAIISTPSSWDFTSVIFSLHLILCLGANVEINSYAELSVFLLHSHYVQKSSWLTEFEDAAHSCRTIFLNSVLLNYSRRCWTVFVTRLWEPPLILSWANQRVWRKFNWPTSNQERDWWELLFIYWYS